MSRLRVLLREHAWGLAGAVAVGLIAVAPQIVFIASLGDAYRGIPFAQTPNEVAYIAMMQEVRDGHPLVASMPFFEYKGNYPLIPPTIPFLYAAASVALGVTLSSVVIASKFLLPALLFFLVYLLLRRFLGSNAPSAVFVAVAGGLLVTLGFDLVDYRSIWGALRGRDVFPNFLIWTRPVNPVSGAILLFTFLLAVWSAAAVRRRSSMLIASAALALMMASYVFAWTLALAVLGVLALAALFRRDRALAFRYAAIVGLALLFSSPYWLMMFKASQISGYTEAVSRIGLRMTHVPHFNKVLFAASLFFACVTFWYRRRNRNVLFGAWWLCSAALLVGGFIAYNQQIITGREIWYYHYVFYTIPFAYVVTVTAAWHFFRPAYPRVWFAAMVALSAASIMLGIYNQMSAYRMSADYYRNMQQYAEVFDFFNRSAERDCVVLANEREGGTQWSNLIPAFTHCNTYISGERTSVIAPQERFYHNYLTLLRLRGISSDDIDGYLRAHRDEASGFLFTTIYYSLGFPDPALDTILARLPDDYRAFMKKDFAQELARYKIDYILTDAPLAESARQSLPRLTRVFAGGGVEIYNLGKQ